MHNEFIAFSDMAIPSPWPGCPRPAVQFTHTQAFYQPVVIPAEAGIQAFFNPANGGTGFPRARE